MSTSFGDVIKLALIALAVMLRTFLGAAVARAQEAPLVSETPSPSEARTDLHGYQFIARPAYSRDSGPVHVSGARLHVEF